MLDTSEQARKNVFALSNGLELVSYTCIFILLERRHT